jgi:hypothetical protein
VIVAHAMGLLQLAAPRESTSLRAAGLFVTVSGADVPEPIRCAGLRVWLRKQPFCKCKPNFRDMSINEGPQRLALY